MTPDMQEKTRENYYRRQAKRLGMYLVKSRAKKWSIDNQQGYMICDAHTGNIVHGLQGRFELSLDDVAALLAEDEKRLREQP